MKAEPRGSKTAEQLMAAEAVRLDAAIPRGARRVVLDEHGTRLTTTQLALKASADETLRLSDLTLPHAFVRVLLAEALYRAWTVMVNHPYHRE